MNPPVATLRSVLEKVPRSLLSVDEARILEDALASVGVIEGFVSEPNAVVLIGDTGVGKSFLVNGLVGSEVSPSGVIRPTTRSSVVAGADNPGAERSGDEFVYAPGATRGAVFVDTPPHYLDPDTVRRHLATASLGILVVTPGRYGDASARDCWEELRLAEDRLVLLNRLDPDAGLAADLVASVEERFGLDEVLIVQEGGDVTEIRSVVAAHVRLSNADLEQVEIATATAASASKRIAGVATTAAVGLGEVADGIRLTEPPITVDRDLTVRESWLSTEQGILEAMREIIGGFDDAIVTSVGRDLAEATRVQLGRWYADAVEQELTEWRDTVSARFLDAAQIRWRRSTTEQLLDQASWKVGVNTDVEVPRRVSRVVGDKLAAVVSESHTDLLNIMNSAIDERRSAWQDLADEIGSFKPGELLVASEALRVH